MMNIKEFAKKISGYEYPARELNSHSQEAKENGFLIIYGMSDDLLEFDGIYSSEIYANDGIVTLVGTKGVKLEAVWCPDEHPETSWLIKPNCEHELFTIMEDGVVFCYGAVISKDQLNA